MAENWITILMKKMAVFIDFKKAFDVKPGFSNLQFRNNVSKY